MTAMLVALERLSELRWTRHPLFRRIALCVALVVLVVGTVVSLRQHPDLIDDLRLGPVLVVALLAVPLSLLLNSIEYVLVGRVLGRRIRWRKALEITVAGTAANTLPVPGGILVRVTGLKEAGAGYRRGASAVLLAALMWWGTAIAYASAWIWAIHPGVPVLAAFGSGVMLLLSAVGLMLRLGGGPLVVSLIALNRLCFVILHVLRVQWCFAALGLVVTFSQASGFAITGIIRSAVPLVPAGIGVTEAAAAALAPLLGISMGAAFLAAALNRVIGLGTVVPIVALLAAVRGQRLALAPSGATSHRAPHG